MVGPDGRLRAEAAAPQLSAALGEAISRRLTEVLTRWQETPIGHRLVLSWPDELTIRYGVLPDESSG
jgi:hypothetical protein